MDPLGHLSPGLSPYNYSFNNPLKYTDPDGRWPEKIHNQILTKAFSGIFNEKQIAILQQASIDVDKNQGAGDSFMHSMRGEGQSIEDAQAKMNGFLDEKQNAFITGKGDDALYSLGEALHPIMDATSPSHEGFQKWEGLDNPSELVKAAIHVVKEMKISDKKLDVTVQKVLDFYYKSVKKKEAETKNNNDN